MLAATRSGSTSRKKGVDSVQPPSFLPHHAPEKKQNTSVAKSNIGASSVAASDGKPPPRNVFKGLLAMPVELLRLISTFFGSPVEVPMGHLTNSTDPALPWSYYDLPDGLRALSQTCHLLRLTFLPMLWESMDVCVQARTGKPAAFYKHLGDSLQRISAGLSHEPELLTYIRTVNVILTRYSTYEILPVFAGTMTKMPNLHTLQVIHAHTAMTTHLKNGFAGISLPNVRQLILPSWAHEILRCCPEVRHVICTADDGGKLVSAIAKCCKKVEILEGFHFDDEKVRKRKKLHVSAIFFSHPK
ncbi:hypothetical protein B0H10DRAFT_1791457 [Mycena sp. CBHHK59/15]|nr:hypothetical protein B0H10DRAFT_1791457 [Mycena sp. CBHHK59/15]